MRRKPFAVIVAMLVLAVCSAQALINPNFTPVELINNAELIAVLKAPAFDDKGKAVAEVQEVLKQPKDAALGKTVTLDLKFARKEHIDEIKKKLAAANTPYVMLFFGKGENGEDLGAIHTPGKWIEIDRTKDVPGSWDVLSLDIKSGSQGMGMEATWAGGTDALLALAKLLLAHPDLTVPSAVGAQWQDNTKIDTVAGKVNRAMAVDLAGKGENVLFLAADNGDKVYQYDTAAKKFVEVAGKLKLATKSRVAAWGDFTGDGRLDLASWDGKALMIAAQAADGTFVAAPVAGIPDGGCVSLQALDVGVKGKAGLAWGTAKGVTLLVPDPEKPLIFAQKALAADGALVSAMGGAIGVLVADFDGDALADVLLVGVNAGILFKGKGGGAFEAGKTCGVAAGPAPADAFLGDWNADGLFDVFAVCDEGCRLWQNDGAGKFRQLIGYSGEVAYISKPRGLCGNVCDINNDGRQDVFLAYVADTAPQVFFNRSFRSFGHAHQPIDLTELQAIPDAANGQQAGVLADLNNDNAQDMAFVLANGEVYVFSRAVESGNALAARVALPAGLASCGPVTVTCDNGVYGMGAWNVQPGVSEAFLARPATGDLNLTWQLPGQPVQKKQIKLGDKPMRLLLPECK
jgi:hypothetical protein